MLQQKDVLPILTTDGREAFEAVTTYNSQSNSIKQLDKCSQTSHSVPIFHLPSLLKPSFRDIIDSYLNHHPTELLSESEEIEYLTSELGFTKAELQDFAYQYSPQRCQRWTKDGNLGKVRKYTNSALAQAIVLRKSKVFDEKIPSLIELRIWISLSDSAVVSKRRNLECRIKPKRDPSIQDKNCSIDPLHHDYSSLLHQNIQNKDRNMHQIFLTKELSSSLSNVTTLRRAIKHDIISAQHLCRTEVGKHPRVQAQLRMWSLQQFLNISNDLCSSFLLASFSRWKKVILLIAKSEKLHRYRQYQSLRIIWLLVGRRLWRKRSVGWVKWLEFIDFERYKEHLELQKKNAQFIQKHWRGKKARIILNKLRHENMVNMAVKIQSRTRAKHAQIRFLKVMEDRAREKTAQYLQSAFRCKRSRKIVRQLREAKERRFAAILMQKVLRGRIGRKKYNIARVEKHKTDSVTKIQKIVRGQLGKIKAKERQIYLRQVAATILMQKRLRVYLCQRRTQKLKVEREKEQQILDKSCRLVQRIFRGHRDRVLVKLRLKTHVTILRRRTRMAIRIQCMLRRLHAIVVVKEMEKKQTEKMIADSRLWKETWSEDAKTWFYYNKTTNESLWEPPATGYTKGDSKLILQNGKIMEDPLCIMTEEQKLAKLKEMSCVDCETALATRLCEQCGDKYCTACYLSAHPKGGKRESHTFVRVGPIECEECNDCVAVRWCTQCDDPFCLACWDKMHGKGNRHFHRYCKIDSEGNVSPRQWDGEGAFVGIHSGVSENKRMESVQDWNQEDHYINSTTMNESDGVHQNTNDSISWVQYFDEGGIPYYYNSVTGEYTYDNPRYDTNLYFDNTEEVTDQPNAFCNQDYQYASNGYDTSPFQTPMDPFGFSGQNTMDYQNSGSIWESHYDQYGNIYYYSRITGETTYDLPVIQE